MILGWLQRVESSIPREFSRYTPESLKDKISFKNLIIFGKYPYSKNRLVTDTIMCNTLSRYAPNMDQIKERLLSSPEFGVQKNSAIHYILTPEYQKQLHDASEIIYDSDMPYIAVNIVGVLVIAFKFQAISGVCISKIEQLIDVSYYVKISHY